ncbi:MAG: DUF4426 domain-containing protein [Gammaproteobacteria bacterium]|nr:DUF4426 domain-containing protein [Gammaproteobacteria bacterium]
MKKSALPFLPLVGILALVACGPQPDPERAGQAPRAAPDTQSTSRDFGDYVLHFNALSTDQLTPEVAKQYDIVRSKNRAMLNVSIVQKQEGQVGQSVSGTVNASARNLTGQLKNLSVREIREGDAVYYIGDVPVANGETLIFSIAATPSNETGAFEVEFSRQFFAD